MKIKPLKPLEKHHRLDWDWFKKMAVKTDMDTYSDLTELINEKHLYIIPRTLYMQLENIHELTGVDAVVYL